MPWMKRQVTPGSWSVFDETGEPRGTGLTEGEADRMVQSSYRDLDRLMGRRPKGMAGPPDSLNPPFTYPSGDG